MVNNGASFESDTQGLDSGLAYNMNFAPFPSRMVLRSDRSDMNHNNNPSGDNIGGGSTALPGWRFGHPLADESISEPLSVMNTLNLYIERLYLFTPVFNMVDVQQNLLVDVPNNLPARRYAFLSAIRAAALAYSGVSSGNREEDSTDILNDAIQARRKYDVIDQGDNYVLEGLLSSFFLFIACWNQDRETHAWWYLRECIGLALSRRLNQEAVYERFNEHEAEHKRRIFWTLFITER